MLADFQICISVPLSELDLKNRSKLWLNFSYPNISLKRRRFSDQMS